MEHDILIYKERKKAVVRLFSSEFWKRRAIIVVKENRITEGVIEVTPKS